MPKATKDIVILNLHTARLRPVPLLAITWALWAPGPVARAEDDAEALARLRSEIAAAVGEPVCGNVSACRLIPMGSDECGNPTLWVPYNNAPDLKIALETKAAEYTFIQEDHQRGKPKRADCVPAVPPRFACVNHRCVLGDASY